MKSFNFKEFIYDHLLPGYVKTYDTYRDENGKGIMERFIDICSEYFNKPIEDIDGYLDILDVDKTPDIYLNQFWSFFGYIPYAYGVLYTGESYNPEQISGWMNNPEVFPRANTRKILKYAISLYKIRCTDDFYNILGRYYGVKFNVQNMYSGTAENPIKDITDLVYNVTPKQVPKPLIVALYGNVGSWYDSETSLGCIKGSYTEGDCVSCTPFNVSVEIPHGIYEVLESENRLEEVRESFTKLISRYLPVNAKIYNPDAADTTKVELIDSYATLAISLPGR
jgi:hypothetical protein